MLRKLMPTRVEPAQASVRVVTKGFHARSGKEPVSDQPICYDGDAGHVEPIWLIRSRVPDGFWQQPENRRGYLLWLGRKLRFSRMVDWYRLTHRDFAKNRGGAVANVWHCSPSGAVAECFPDYDWHEWRFAHVPRAFWQSLANRRRYFAWLADELGLWCWEDWYHVTTLDFQSHCGGALLLEYRSSVAATVIGALSEYDWKEWRFTQTPQYFWNTRQNRRRYLAWLAERLGYQCLDDWYRVMHEDFRRNDGLELVRLFRGSAAAVVMDTIQRDEWHEWKFTRVPPGFWRNVENRRRYALWLGERLGFRRPEDWLCVRRKDFRENHGGTLLFMYRTCGNLLAHCLPELCLPVQQEA